MSFNVTHSITIVSDGSTGFRIELTLKEALLKLGFVTEI